jgi:hypothetical protein
MGMLQNEKPGRLQIETVRVVGTNLGGRRHSPTPFYGCMKKENVNKWDFVSIVRNSKQPHRAFRFRMRVEVGNRPCFFLPFAPRDLNGFEARIGLDIAKAAFIRPADLRFTLSDSR